MISYQGSLRLPYTPGEAVDHFSNAGRLAWDRERQKLAVQTRRGRWSYITLPGPVVSSDVNALPIAGFDGVFQPAPPAPPFPGGLEGFLVRDGELYLTNALDYYDAGNIRTVGTWVGGAWRALVPSNMQGYGAGYACWVPDHCRAEHGSFIVGCFGVPIITRTSYGPAAWACGEDNGFWSQPMVYYPGQHPLGQYFSSDPLFNHTFLAAGCAVVGDYLDFYGSIGIGEPGYGIGVATPEEVRVVTSSDGDTHYVYDPDYVGGPKGNHGWPYIYVRLRFRRADILAAVNPWDVVPEVLRLPDEWFLQGRTQLGTVRQKRVFGMTSDEQGRIFLMQLACDHSNRAGYYPVLHVLQDSDMVITEPEPIPEPEPEPPIVVVPTLEQRVSAIEEKLRRISEIAR